MKITLKNILPKPLQQVVSPQSDVWLSDVNFLKGEAAHVCAPSGSGKSTLVGILYGTRSDYSGELFFNDVNVSSHNPNEWADWRKNKIAVIFQELELLADLTAYQNIEIKNQLTQRYNKNQINHFASQLGVVELLDQKVGLLSRGERQRIAIIRSLCMSFDWLLMDEPFSALDELNTQKATNLIEQVVAENEAGIIVANVKTDDYFRYSHKLQMV